LASEFGVMNYEPSELGLALSVFSPVFYFTNCIIEDPNNQTNGLGILSQFLVYWYLSCVEEDPQNCGYVLGFLFFTGSFSSPFLLFT
jgi:hypothetical protein